MWVVGNDAARGGWAWCVADAEGPIAAGWVAVGHLTQPWVGLARYLAEVYAPMLQGLLPHGLAVVVEVPGLQVGRVNRRRKEGDANEAAGKARGSDGAGAAGTIAFGQGLAAGPVLLAAGALGIEPETRTPGEWRKHWSIKGKRDDCKAQAELLVTRLFPDLEVGVASWGAGLTVTPTRLSRLTVGQRSDVCEAVLIAVGHAQEKKRAALKSLRLATPGAKVTKPARQRAGRKGG